MTFAIYKGEKFLDEGTAEELAERFGLIDAVTEFLNLMVWKMLLTMK